MKKILLLVLIILISILGYFFLIKRNSNQKIKNKIISISLPAKVKTLDPIRAIDDNSTRTIALIYEGLLSYDFPYGKKLIPNLLEAMPELTKDEQGKPVYIFKLKKGIKFHSNICFKESTNDLNNDIKELTSEDVVFSFKRIASQESLCFWLMDDKIVGINDWRKNFSNTKPEEWRDIEGIKIIDKYTFSITLNKQDNQFLFYLAHPMIYIVSKKAALYYKDNLTLNPVGTGPFYIKEFSPQIKKIILYKNNSFKKIFPKVNSDNPYHKGFEKYEGYKLPLIDELHIHIITEPHPRWFKFLNKELDIIDAIPKDNFSQAITKEKKLKKEMKDKGIILKHSSRFDLIYIAFNHKLKLFQNEKLRQAISTAYSTKEISHLFYNDMGRPAKSLLPPGMNGFDDSYISPYKIYDLDKAKKLLKEAGYPEGKGLPEIELTVQNATFYRQLGEHFKNSMKKIGVSVKINTNSYPELMRKRSLGTMMMFNMIYCPLYPDPQSFLQILYGPNKCPGINDSNFDDENYNRLYIEMLNSKDDIEKIELCKKMDKIIAYKVPLLYMIHRLNFVLHHGYIKNYALSNFCYGKEMYLDSEKN